jgi:hypothetical protein
MSEVLSGAELHARAERADERLRERLATVAAYDPQLFADILAVLDDRRRVYDLLLARSPRR